MNRFYMLFFTLIFSLSAFAQYESLWTKAYGGISMHECNALCAAADTCYLLTGYTG